MLAYIDDIINANNNDNVDSAVNFLDLRMFVSISKKKKNEKVLHNRKVCQWFHSLKLFWDCFEVIIFQVRDNYKEKKKLKSMLILSWLWVILLQSRVTKDRSRDMKLHVCSLEVW